MKKIIALSVISGILLTATAIYSEKMQKGISAEIVRLHVLANSNSKADQALKLKVRDRILKESKDLFGNTVSKEQCYEILDEKIPFLTAAAKDEIQKNGYSYEVKISRGNYFFPMKNYENFSLPAGDYDALKIEIGSGNGENWWCVMFPPLCFVDATLGKNTMSQLEGKLTDEELALISSPEEVNIKFKIVDFFQNSFHKAKMTFKK